MVRRQISKLEVSGSIPPVTEDRYYFEWQLKVFVSCRELDGM